MLDNDIALRGGVAQRGRALQNHFMYGPRRLAELAREGIVWSSV